MNTRDSVDPYTARAIDVFLGRLDSEQRKLPPIRRTLLYGSRARGTNHEESDVDIAVVLAGKRKTSEDRSSISSLLSDLNWDVLGDTGLYVFAWPVWERELSDPYATGNPHFFRSVSEDGIEWEWQPDP